MKKITLLLATMFVAVGMNAQYCIPTQLDCTDGDLITLFEFAGISNPSGCDGGYSDYTNTVSPAEVEAGSTYTLSATVGGGWTYETVGVWFDFDNSETFDFNEFFLIGTGSSSVVVGDVTIPGDVADGTYRLRVSVLASDMPFDDPCFPDFNYGEMEDYLVDVSGSVSVEDNNIAGFAFYPNPIVDVINLKASQNLDSVTIFNLLGQNVLDVNINNNNTTVNVSSLEAGVYIMTVTSGSNTEVHQIVKK